MSEQKIIFITGASGYIGSVITEFALAEGYKVRGLSRSEKSDAKILQLGGEPVRGDLTTLDVLRREAAGADVVINLADPWASHIADDYSEVVREDEAAVAALLDGLRAGERGGRLIATGGSAVAQPDPTGAATDETAPPRVDSINRRIDCELNALRNARAAGVPAAVVRLSPFVYGRGASGVRLFMQRSVPARCVVCVRDGSERTSTVHVDDAARLYLLLASRPLSPGAADVFNCTSDDHPTFREVLGAMADAIGLPLVHKSLDETSAGFAAAFAPMFPGNPAAAERIGMLMARFRSSQDISSSAKAARELGWSTREASILDDIRDGSYKKVAEELRKSIAA